MAQVPEGAQRSEDGAYWWDGSQWQAVAAATGGPQHSPDGQFVWDGSEWKPAAAADQAPLDLSEYPVIQALLQAGEAEGWLRWMGLDPEELAAAGNCAPTS